MSRHQQKILDIYKKCFASVEEDSPLTYVFAQAGKAYALKYKLNVQSGYIVGDEFDHEAVFYIAQHIEKNIKNKWLKGLSVEEVASRITGQILNFYKLQNHSDKAISILFLAADPTDGTRLRLGEEAREIQERVQLAEIKGRLTFEQRTSVRPEDISLALLKTRPRIVHFSGHGTEEGSIYLEGRNSKSQPATAEAVAALFRHFSNDVCCVVLNACYSEMQARAIARHIDYVIGMADAITDAGAIAFSIGFYQALGSGESIPEAFRFGCIQINLQGIPDNLTPVLMDKNTISRIV